MIVTVRGSITPLRNLLWLAPWLIKLEAGEPVTIEDCTRTAAATGVVPRVLITASAEARKY